MQQKSILKTFHVLIPESALTAYFSTGQCYMKACVMTHFHLFSSHPACMCTKTNPILFVALEKATFQIDAIFDLHANSPLLGCVD